MLLQDGLVVVTHALHVKGHWSRICSPKVLTPSPPTLTSRSFVLLHQSLIEGFSEHTITSSMSLQNFPEPVVDVGPSSSKFNSASRLVTRAAALNSAVATGRFSAKNPMKMAKVVVRGRFKDMLLGLVAVIATPAFFSRRAARKTIQQRVCYTLPRRRCPVQFCCQS